MTNKEHTEILAAYLMRLNISDIEAIHKAKMNQCRAAMNVGNSAQMVAYNDTCNTIAKAIGNLLPHDVENINKVLAKTVRANACAH